MCDCPRCEFDRENGGISMGNEIGAIKALLVPGPDEQARAEVNANLNRPPVLRNACTELEDALEFERKTREAEEWEALYSIAVGQVLELREELRAIAVFLPPRLPHESLAQVADMVVRQRDEWERTARQRHEDVRSWVRVAQQMQEEIDFLTSGLQNYASHAWNDIKRELKERGWL